MNRTQLAIAVACVCSCVLIGTLVGVSFSKLSANEVGLDYSGTSLTLDTSKLYESGIHFLGVAHSFIKFSRSVQELDMRSPNNVVARTKDGLQVTLDTRLLYRLDVSASSLGSMWLLYENNYGDAISSASRSVIRDVASKFTAFEFWQSRENITLTMSGALDKYLQDFFFARVDQFLLTNFQLPTKFQNAITETDVKKQEKEKVQFEQDTVVTEIATQILQTQRTVDIITQNAAAAAEAYLLGVDAQVVQVQTAVDAELKAYSSLRAKLNMTQEELSSFVWLETLTKTASQTNTFLSLKSPSSLTV